MKKCKYCAEEVKDEAIKCKHCQSDLSVLDTDNLGKATDFVIFRIFKIISLTFIVLIVIGNLINLSQTSYSETRNDIDKLERGLQQYRQAIKDAEDSSQKNEMELEEKQKLKEKQLLEEKQRLKEKQLLEEKQKLEEAYNLPSNVKKREYLKKFYNIEY